MKSSIILLTVLSILAIVTLAFGGLPAHGVISDESETFQSIKEAFPQIVFLIVLFINLGTSLIDSDRNFKASLIATLIVIAITHWGGFYKPLLDFLSSKI